MQIQSMRYTLKRLLASSLIVGFLSLALAQAPLVVQTNLDIMLNAVKDSIYGSFVSAASDEFKTSYTQEAFIQVSQEQSARLKQGYEATYLGSLNMKGYTVYLWKLSYQDAKDDSLVSLSIQNGFVVGFLIQ